MSKDETSTSTPRAVRSYQLIEFERAQVVSPRIYPPRDTLVVTGQKPLANMNVTLMPLMYVQTPEYWGIEVLGSTPAIGRPGLVPYVVDLELGATVGTAGIEVIGANRSEKIDLSPPSVVNR